MRHINFRISPSGEVVSLDGFNRDQILTRALIGDSSGTLKFTETQWLLRDYANFTLPGLPVMDTELLTALNMLSDRCNPVFWFPATELHGMLRREEIFERIPLNWEERFLNFQGEDRFCYGNQQFLRLSTPDVDKLLDNYLAIVTGLLEKYPNLYLVPVVNRFLGSRAPMYFRAYSPLTRLDRCLNLDWLDPDDPDFWADDSGHLSRKSWTILMGQLDSL